MCARVFWPARVEALDEDEVFRRVNDYAKAEIRTEVFQFGQQLVDEGLARNGALESKGAIILGFGTALLAFLGQPQSPPMEWWQKTAAAFSFAAVLAASLALSLRPYRWFSESLWFLDPEVIGESDDLLRTRYLKAMRRVVFDAAQQNARKANLVRLGQYALLVGAATLFLAIAWTRT